MINNYILSEADSDVVFAVISGIDSTDSNSRTLLVNKTSIAVKENFCYKIANYNNGTFSERNGKITFSLNCFDEDAEDDEEEEIREIELNLVAIY
jgi:hypothetical protein